MPNQRLFVMDPSLVDCKGHHLATSIGLARAAELASVEVVSIGNRAATEAVSRHGVVPGFSDSIYGPPPPSVKVFDDPKVVEAMVSRPARELADLVEAYRIGPEDVVYLHTLTPRYACSLLEALALTTPRSTPLLVLMFRYDPEAEPWVGDFKSLAAALARADRRGMRGRIMLVAETEDLAELYADRLARPVRALLHFPTARIAPRALAEAAPATVAFLGEARVEKGFPAFVDAIAVLTERRTREHLRFVAQSYCAEPIPEEIARATARLRESAPHLDGEIHGALDDDAFVRLLAQADVVVAPYRPESYRRRGSGLFVDAVASGAVVVVRAGTWMSRFADLPNVLVFEEDADLAETIDAAVVRARGLSREEAARRVEGVFAAASHIDALFSPRDDEPKDDGNAMTNPPLKALVLTKFWPHTGAAHVFRNQVTMLLAAGFDVSVATITSYALDKEPDAATYQWYRDEMALPPVTFQWICFADPHMLAAMSEIARGMIGAEDSWTAETMRAIATELPLSLKRACRDDPPDLILCNYLSHLPLAGRLKGPDTRIVVETHDICSIQHAVTHDLPLSEVDYRAELSAGRGADGLVFINAEEAAAFDSAGVLTPAITILPARPLHLEPDWAEAIADAEARLDRPALVAATQKMLARMIGPATNPAGAVMMGLGMRRTSKDRKLLVYVGSDHQWNLRGLGAFIEQVFVPHLQPAGYVLVVVGSICDWVGQTFPDAPGVIRAGVLPDLRPVYEMPAILVLPVLGGTGFPIKTLDALASGLPVVGTPLAFRGLDGTALGARVAELQDMACAICEAAAEPFVRRAPPTALSLESYCRKWARFLSQRLGRKIEIASDPQVVLPPLVFHEGVANLLQPPLGSLTPIPAGRYPVTPETLPRLVAGSFGFKPKDSETHWLWASSWYFGFLFEPAARSGTLEITLHKLELVDWVWLLDIYVLVDAVPHRVTIGKQTTEVSIPLHDADRGADEPVLVEIMLPEAVWRPNGADFLDERVLSFCITQVATHDEQAPLDGRPSD